MKKIQLTKNMFATVDDCDFEKVIKIRWCCCKNRNIIYAINGTGKQKIYMHRYILNSIKGEIIDHIDGNGLNNTRQNLRVVTHSQNSANRNVSSKKEIKYLGVYKVKDKFRAASRKNKKLHSAGEFLTELEAAIAYNKLAISLHGEFARLNNI